MTWFQIWTMAWQVSVFLTPIIVGAVVLWMRSQFVTKADAIVERNRIDGALAAAAQAAKAEANRVDAVLTSHKTERDSRWDHVRDELADHKGRIVAVEKDSAKPPSRHQLNNAIAVLQGSMHGVERGLGDVQRQMESQSADLRRQMETLNSYLHTVIEKHLQ